MSSVYMQHDDDNAPCLCTNCGTTTPFVKLNSIDDIEQRISPGDEVPAGECPECGCLAYLVKPKEWTVLLLRPDYYADEYGTDTYLAHVEAENAERAVYRAQGEAVVEDHASDESTRFADLREFAEFHDRTDYLPLLVIEGKHQDRTP